MDVLAVSTTYAFTQKWGVTLKMIIDYLNAIKFDQQLIARATVTKLTKKLAFLLITFEDKETRTALAQASVVMMITDNSRVVLKETSGSAITFKENPKL